MQNKLSFTSSHRIVAGTESHDVLLHPPPQKKKKSTLHPFFFDELSPPASARLSLAITRYAPRRGARLAYFTELDATPHDFSTNSLINGEWSPVRFPVRSVAPDRDNYGPVGHWTRRGTEAPASVVAISWASTSTSTTSIR